MRKPLLLKFFAAIRHRFMTVVLVSMLLPLGLSAADPNAVMVNMTKRKLSVSELISQIQRRTPFVFVYDPAEINTDNQVSISAGDNSVASYLKEAFADSDIAVKYTYDYIILQSAKNQGPIAAGTTISGVVKDDSGNAVIGATIVAMGKTMHGVLSGVKGDFSIKLNEGDRLLEISYVGMQKEFVALNPATKKLDVTIKPQYSNIDEVVVIGYGAQAKRDVTGAITSISSNDIAKTVGGDISSILQGKAPGMSIISNSGEPGGGSTVTIRGAASMNGSSEPLYIVDGVPFSAGNIKSLDGDASFSALAGLNTSDIESVEVLRDAASAAIYGSRAANGVVIITTKGGSALKTMEPVVSVSHISSLASVSRKHDAMSADQFRTAYVEARRNGGYTATNPWIINPTHPYYLQSTDWQDVIFRQAYQHKTDLSVRGSSEKFAYSVSMGYRNTKPVIVGTSYDQYNVRTNFTYKITKAIKAGTNIAFTKIDYDRVLSGNSTTSALNAALLTNPCYSPYDPTTGEMVLWLGQREQRNPLALALGYPINFKRTNISLNQYVSVNFMKGLDLKVNVSTDINKTQQSNYMSRDFDSATEANRKDVANFRQNDASNYMNENILTYGTKVDGHSFDVVLGQSLQFNRGEVVDLRGENYIDQSVIEIQYADKMTTVSRDISENVLLSFFGRLNYNYKSRYLASFTLRRDGSSRFGPENRFGNFPSASLGWRFSDEPFMKFAKSVLDDAKFRASYGVTGNQNMGDYAWMGVYQSDSKRYGGSVAITNDGLPNMNLGWEKTTQYNVGIDLSMFNGRVTLSADAYIKRSTDLLFNFPIPVYTSFSSYPTNFGEIENKGLEFLVNTVNITAPFQWKSNFNISFNRNKIVKLPQGTDIIVGSYSLAREGQPAGVFYTHNSLGIYANSSDNMWVDPSGIVSRPVLKGSAEGDPFKGGDMIWADLDGNGIIDDNDRMIVGSPHPKFIGGFGNTFSYKNFSLNIFLSFSYGNQIMNDFRRSHNRMTSTGNIGLDALARWRYEGDKASFPMLRYGDAMENFRPSNFSLEDGSYLRLKDISFTYRIPEKLCQKIRLKGISTFVSAQNLLTWSGYSGYDPEVNSSTNPFIFGVDNGAFPKSRTFNFGVDITF